MQNKTKVITGEVRLSYANAWEPKSTNGGRERHSISVIIPRSDQKTIEKIEKAIDAAIDERLSRFNGKKPNKKTIKFPSRDGDIEKDDEACADTYFLNANSMTAPQIVDRNVEPIFDRNEVYPGVYVRVSPNFYAYNVDGNKGVAVGFGNTQKLRDGQPLGNRSNAADDFGTMDDDNKDSLA